MEYCKGDNLRNFIDKYMNNNSLIEENVLYKIIKQICLGIKEIHEKKIVHRDLKPENIFIDEEMNIKIGDFGISKKLNSYKTYALTIKKTGTDYYISPEILYKGIYNEKSDIWSLGCIIYELFNLSFYLKDKLFDDIKKIDPKMYNYKWQELIDSLLLSDYNKRFDINQIITFLEDNLNINHKSIIEKVDDKTKNMSINNTISNESFNNNIIIGDIFIREDDVNKDIKIIN